MDIATVLGLIGALAFIAMAMLLGGNFGMYVDLPSVLIVFGGSTFVVLMQYPMRQFFLLIQNRGQGFCV